MPSNVACIRRSRRGEKGKLMNDIIWVINPGNDKLESVSARMRRFGSTILEAKNIDFHFEGDEILENISLPMNVRRNIYLVFKELINNAAKHSACTFVKVHFRQDQKQIRLSIEDNGKGFELSKSHDGNGMKNIQSRCREIGAKLDIYSHGRIFRIMKRLFNCFQ